MTAGNYPRHALSDSKKIERERKKKREYVKKERGRESERLNVKLAFDIPHSKGSVHG